MPKEKDTVKIWNEKAAKLLVGKKVKAVSYATDEELEAMGWDRRPLVIEFEDGTSIYPSQDDEGNGPGALFTSSKETPILPVI